MIQVVFQNKNFIVCNKPGQVLSVVAREKNDPRPCLAIDLQNELKQKIYPVHRLDYEVSGLIIYALDEKSHKISQNWFEKKLIRKKYLAQTLKQNFSHWPENISTDKTVIDSAFSGPFNWKTQILRGKKRSFESPNGQWAETEANIKSVSKDSDADILNWELYPITGKPHQLRLELSRRGFPIIGDKLYGSNIEHKLSGIALTSYEINLSKIDDTLGLPKTIALND